MCHHIPVCWHYLVDVKYATVSFAKSRRAITDTLEQISNSCPNYKSNVRPAQPIRERLEPKTSLYQPPKSVGIIVTVKERSVACWRAIYVSHLKSSATTREMFVCLCVAMFLRDG